MFRKIHWKYILLINLFFSLVNCGVEISSCINGERTVILEDGKKKNLKCINCAQGKYTIYDESKGELVCENCPKYTSNLGKDILLNYFSEKNQLKYSFSSSCSNIEGNDSCPKWTINEFSLKTDFKKSLSYSSIITMEPYFMNEGELKIKFINFNGGLDKAFNLYINENLVYSDDSEHSIIKTKSFNIKKGENKIKFEYLVDARLKNIGINKENDAYLEILEIRMNNIEVSALDCEKYNPLDELRTTLLNNCEYDVSKCSSENDYCTFRFYSEDKDEFCYVDSNSREATYKKIVDAKCKELVIPHKKEISCNHCTYGQYSSIDDITIDCRYCRDNTYNSKSANDEESCEEICDIENGKQSLKLFYINNFEDPSKLNLEEINIIEIVGSIKINYEKFDETKVSYIFIELEKNQTTKLINPDDDNILSNFYSFTLPLSKGKHSIKIIGNNLKLTQVVIKGAEEGGNFNCVDKLNTEEEIICENQEEHYSKIEKKCLKCPLGSQIDKNGECIFINQFFNGKFTLDNNLLNPLLFSKTYTLKENQVSYYLKLNPGFPLLYSETKDSEKDNYKLQIIGKELKKSKLVKGKDNRGIILSYKYEDDKTYDSYVFLKCDINSEKPDISINKVIEENDTLAYFFTIKSKDSCPYCLNSEISLKDSSKCIDGKKEINIIPNKDSLCVIKSFDENESSKLVDDKNILLSKSSTDPEDQSFISIYEIKENIPIDYEQKNDKIITSFKKIENCEEEKEKGLGTLYIILIIVGILLVILIISIIICQIRKRKNKIEEEEPKRESLCELVP